ncbi:MAG: tetratricopeptide repeat protein [Legionellales bacterium]
MSRRLLLDPRMPGRRLIASGLLMLASISVQALNWTDLWLNPDQQGQLLMTKGDYVSAKDVFKDSNWRAAAAYKAGDYKRSAALLKEAETEQAYYNKANALAHLGQYQQAIQAYDKALAMNPHDQDAIYNRKLVKELMKKDQEKQQNKEQQNKEQQDKEQQDKEQQNKEQQDKEQQDKEQQDKEQQDKEQQDKEQQNKEQQDKEQQDKEQQDKEQQDKEQQDKEQQDKEQQDKEQQDKEQQDKEQQDKEQQDKEQQNKEQQDKNKSANKSDATAAQDQEKQQAKKQWLKLVPDDPGGLMREKFLRDHLRRELGWSQ